MVSEVQHNKLISAHTIVCSPPEVWFHSVTKYLTSFTYFAQPLPPFLGTSNLWSLYMSGCFVCSFFVVVLYSTYEQNHTIFAFFHLRFFIQTLKVRLVAANSSISPFLRLSSVRCGRREPLGTVGGVVNCCSH